MQHVWQFYLEYKDETKPPLHLNYVTQSNRKSKVVMKIQKDLKKHLNVTEAEVKNFYIRKLR